MQKKERERAKKTHLILNKLSKVAGRTEKGPHEGRGNWEEVASVEGRVLNICLYTQGVRNVRNHAQ